MEALAKLTVILEKSYPLLIAISPEEAARRPGQGKWSRKQELGHLIDSACNNHQRIVRAQIETEPALPDYDGDRWVDLHNYQGVEWHELIARWRVMNEHLLRATQVAWPEAASCKLKVGGKDMTLAFLIQDYVDHLLHHLKHIGIATTG